MLRAIDVLEKRRCRQRQNPRYPRLHAFLILCLLEFRVSQNENWLNALALVMAWSMANNWALIVCAFHSSSSGWLDEHRLLLASRFLLHMILCGCAGLLLYGLTPLLGSRAKRRFLDVAASNLTRQHIALHRIPKYYVLIAAIQA